MAGEGVDYDILAHPAAPLPDEINKQGFAAVTNPSITETGMRINAENKRAEQADQERQHAKREADIERVFSKVHNTPNQAEQSDVENLVKDFHGTVTDNTPDLYSKDINKRLAANATINESLNTLNNKIDASKARKQLIQDELLKMQKTQDAGGDYHQEDKDRFLDAVSKSYVNGSENDLRSSIPKPALNIQNLFDKQYAPALKNTGVMVDNPYTSLDGQITHNYSFDNSANKPETNAANFADVKQKMLANQNITEELGKQVREAVKANPDNEALYYNHDAAGNRTGINYEARLNDILAHYTPSNKLTSGNPPQTPEWQVKEGKGEDKNALSIANKYDPTTGTNELSFGNPPKAYHPVPLASGGEDTPLAIKIKEVPNGKGGTTTIGIGVFQDPYAKKEYASLLSEKQKTDKKIEDYTLQYEANPDDASLKDKIALLEKENVANEEKRNALKDKTIEEQIGNKDDTGSIAVNELKRAHPTLTTKDVYSYLKKEKAETGNGIIYSGYDKGNTSWQQQNGVHKAKTGTKSR